MTKATRTFLPLALVVAVGVAGTEAVAWAGDDDHAPGHKSCKSEAAACVREMAGGLAERGWIGIEWDDEADRPVLTQVVPNSPAEAAGLEAGDELLAFNDVPTDAGEEAVWAEAKKSLVPDNTITLKIRRGEAVKSIDVKLVAIPRHVIAQWVGNHMLEYHVEEPKEAEAPRP